MCGTIRRRNQRRKHFRRMSNGVQSPKTQRFTSGGTRSRAGKAEGASRHGEQQTHRARREGAAGGGGGSG